MNAVVLISSTAPGRTRAALQRALERLPARIEESAASDRGSRLLHLAADAATDWIVVVDDDAMVLPATFGSLSRAQSTRPAIIGGQAHVDGSSRFGASFAHARSGPDPFELAPIAGITVDRVFLAAIRGPIDVPQRGVLVVEAAFLRSLGNVSLDPVALNLDLAVHARVAGRVVLCEPSMTFSTGADSPDVVRALGRLRRYAALDCWKPESLHREPAALRALFVHREVRMAGDIRGYQRVHRPPVDALIDASAVRDVETMRRILAGYGLGGRIDVFPGDAATLRAALVRTGDRYVALIDAEPAPPVTAIIALCERLERSGRFALALAANAAPFGIAMFHARRIVGAARYAGGSARDVVADAIERLPGDRLFAVGPAGEVLAPERLAPLPSRDRIDVAFVSASKPEVASQTVRPVVQDSYGGRITAVVAEGSETIVRVLSVFADVQFEYDAVDPLLARALNRVLAQSTADAVLIVRDDVQVPRGAVAALRGAFARIPRLGVAVPRIRDFDRPEAQDPVGYANMSEMQDLQDRRSAMYPREARLVEGSTVPLLLVSREVLATVGGFDERYGFSQFGIVDFTRRVRAANFLIAQCDDAFAHVFPREIVESALADIDVAAYMRDAYEASWAGVTEFDPVRHRIGARADDVRIAEHDVLHVLAFVEDNAHWSRFRPHFAALAGAWRASDPVEIVIGIGPGLSLPATLAEVRETLMRSGRPLEETVNVILQTRPDPEVWDDVPVRAVCLAGFEHPALAHLARVDDAGGIRSMLETISA